MTKTFAPGSLSLVLDEVRNWTHWNPRRVVNKIEVVPNPERHNWEDTWIATITYEEA
jgi:hypothetical protein